MQRLDGRFIYAASDLNDYLECKRLPSSRRWSRAGRLHAPDSLDEQTRADSAQGRRARARLSRQLIWRVIRTASCSSSAPRPGSKTIARPSARRSRRCGAARRSSIRRRSSTGSSSATPTSCAASTARRRTWATTATRSSTRSSGSRRKPYYLVQLCNYSEHLERLQGCMPEFGYVVFGNGEEQRFRLQRLHGVLSPSQEGVLTRSSRRSGVRADGRGARVSA